jgi:hypothetical protein
MALALAAQLALASPGADAWKRAEIGVIRGMTIGPIENGLHPGVGYGSPAYDRALVEAKRMGATWVAITPFGRVLDLSGTGIDLSFEAPFETNRRDIARAIGMAHSRGLRVMLVPHLWIESGGWRGELEPSGDAGWRRWAESYDRFLRVWAEVAQSTRTDMLSVGVELRSWLTTDRAPTFVRVIQDVRRAYRGLITYSANWDDVDDTVILGQIDVIGINAFYKLAEVPGTPEGMLLEAARTVRSKIHALAERWQKPVVFTETGYTTRPDPAYRPWEWPDVMSAVKVDETAQATAYRALITPLIDEPDFAGLFVWRLYADPDDTSQEAPWGFSPRGKQSELVVRDAFAARWAGDPWWLWSGGEVARTPGLAPY